MTIIVSNFNGWRMGILQACLESVSRLDYPKLQVILVDNRSSDNSVENAMKMLSAMRIKLKAISNSENNYSRGLNLGMKEAQGKYLIFINNDILLDRSYLFESVAYMEEHPEIALAQGKLLSYYDHSRIDSAGETMDLYGNPVTIGGGANAAQFRQPGNILSASGSATIARASALRNLGGYDRSYYIGYEDMDLALRARSQGYSIAYIPTAFAYHMRGKTDQSPEARLLCKFHFDKNRATTIIKNYSLAAIIKALPITILLYLAAIVVELLKDRFAAPARAKSLIWVLMNLKSFIQIREDIGMRRKVPFSEIEKLMIKGRLAAILSGLIGKGSL